MTNRYGVSGNEVDGVFFTEASSIPGAEDLGELKVKINGQNKDLRAVKAELARRVKSKGGTVSLPSPMDSAGTHGGSHLGR
jgi:hypothetical protein